MMTNIQIKMIVDKLGELTDIVRSVVLVGSFSSKEENDHSDIDFLVITHKDIGAYESSLIGDSFRSATQRLLLNDSFVFYNPVCERCKFPSKYYFRFHLITHSWINIKQWIEQKVFIACMWANGSSVLWGENPFDSIIIPELNDSILDELDGIPSYANEINNILITKDPSVDHYLYGRYCKYYMDRISELKLYFPSMMNEISIPLEPTGKSGLIEISICFSKIQEAIEIALNSKKGENSTL